MKTKIYLLISVVSCLFFQCMDEEEQQFESLDSTELQQKESFLKIDSTSTSDSLQYNKEAEVDPPKDKDPYIKKW